MTAIMHASCLLYDTQVLQASIAQKECASLPIGLHGGVTTVINDKLRSTVEEEQLMMMSTLSTAMTHHKTSGPLYHHFLSNGLVWVDIELMVS